MKWLKWLLCRLGLHDWQTVEIVQKDGWRFTRHRQCKRCAAKDEQPFWLTG